MLLYIAILIHISYSYVHFLAWSIVQEHVPEPSPVEILDSEPISRNISPPLELYDPDTYRITKEKEIGQRREGEMKKINNDKIRNIKRNKEPQD